MKIGLMIAESLNYNTYFNRNFVVTVSLTTKMDFFGYSYFYGTELSPLKANMISTGQNSEHILLFLAPDYHFSFK